MRAECDQYLLPHHRYVQENVLQPGDAHYKQFHKIFEAFKISADDSETAPKATPISHIPDDDSMSIAAKSSAAQKKQREEDSDDVSFVLKSKIF